VVKQYHGHHVVSVSRRLAHGCLDRTQELIAMAQTGLGQINTAFIERLNATFRARMPALARRTRSLARTTQRLETESGAVYNFCTIHTTLQGTPAMAAGLTDQPWSIEQLLRYGSPNKSLHVIL
jgi:hypothetical protein